MVLFNLNCWLFKNIEKIASVSTESDSCHTSDSAPDRESDRAIANNRTRLSRIGTLAVHKPDPACIQYIWDNLDKPFSTDNTVMIGDSMTDVKTAMNAHIKMIAVTHGTDTPDTMRQHGAEHFIESFDELLVEPLIEQVFTS